MMNFSTISAKSTSMHIALNSTAFEQKYCSLYSKASGRMQPVGNGFAI